MSIIHLSSKEYIMLDYDDIKSRVSEIISIGDEAKASTKIIELNDIITQSKAQDEAELTNLQNEIEAKKNRIEELENDNKEIRQANADVMLKYGQLLTQTQPIVTPVVQEEEEKALSWEEISKME